MDKFTAPPPPPRIEARGVGIGRGVGERERSTEKEERQTPRPKCLDYTGKGLWGKGSPAPGGRVCQVGTERYWENLEARPALICKIYTSVLCPGLETKQ